MPRDLPRPLSTLVAGDGAGRCRLPQGTDQTRPHTHDERQSLLHSSLEAQKQHLRTSSSSELPDALFDPDSVSLPCPSFTGPFSVTSALKRISAGLKPFVRLPLRPPPDLDTSAKQIEGRRRRTSSLPQYEGETQPYTYTSFDDLAPVSPAPWPPVRPMRVASIRPERSSTLLTMNSESSAGTHHMTMMDIYLTGKLATQHGSPPSQPDNKSCKKKKRTRQNRRSTLRHSIPNTRAPSRFSAASRSRDDSFASRTSRQSSTSSSSQLSFLTARTSISRTASSISLADTSAQGTFWRPSSPRAAEASLQATLIRFPAPPPRDPTPPVSPASWQKSLFMFPHEHDRRNTASTTGTASTLGSTLTDSLAVSYRQTGEVARRFVDGYWAWERLAESGPVVLGGIPEDGEEVKRSLWGVFWSWTLLRWR